jgi:NitT/TauT family transport system ATP-binding protein
MSVDDVKGLAQAIADISSLHLQNRTMPPMQKGAGVQLIGLRRVFDGNVAAIDGIDLSVKPGEFLAILGPSGCGKSTLLRIIAGLDKPTQGRVELAPEAKLAYVFQDAHLLPWRNVLRNVALPLELMGAPKPSRMAAAEAALRQVGLADAMTRYPAQLSGGMRMRVSLARALVTEPTLLLLDEPFAALDEITRQLLDEQLRHLWLSQGLTVIFVTHSTGEAVFLADRAVALTSRPARVVQDRPIDLPRQRPAAIRGTAEFAAQTRFIFEALKQS